MTEQFLKQSISLRQLQPENYLKSPGKFYTISATNKNYVFKDYKIPSVNKSESPFITNTQSMRDQSLNSLAHSRVHSEAGITKTKNQIELDLNPCLPKLNTTSSKMNLSRQDNSVSIAMKRAMLPSINASNPDMLRSFMKNEIQSSKVDIPRKKKLSHDFSLHFKVSMSNNQTLEKKQTLKHEDLMDSSSISLVNKNFQKSNTSYLWMNELGQSQQDSPRGILYTQTDSNTRSMQLNNNNTSSYPSQKHVKLHTDFGASDIFNEETDLNVTYNKVDKPTQHSIFKSGLDDSSLIHEIIPQVSNKIRSVPHRDEDVKSKLLKRGELPTNKKMKSISFKQNLKNEDKMLIRRYSKYNMDGDNKSQDLNHYLNYLKHSNSPQIAQANLDHGVGQKKMERNIEEHLLILEQILHSNDSQEEHVMRTKLKKVAQQIIKVKQFQNQLGFMASMKKNKGSIMQKMQFQKDLEKFNNQLSPDHSIFIKEFYYTIQEFIELISSNKRASLMIQSIRGFNPIIKQILFIDDEIRKDLTLDVLEKQIVSVMQFVQLKKENQTEKMKAKLQMRRRGMWFELNHESVKELQFFYKNLREHVDNKNFDNKICMQSEFYQDLDEIEKIIYRYILHPNTDKIKFKNQCFKDLKVAYKEEIPQFVQNNKPLQNLTYWEKHLGKFDMVSDYVREKDQQISNMCKIYQNL